MATSAACEGWVVPNSPQDFAVGKVAAQLSWHLYMPESSVCEEIVIDSPNRVEAYDATLHVVLHSFNLKFWDVTLQYHFRSRWFSVLP